MWVCGSCAKAQRPKEPQGNTSVDVTERVLRFVVVGPTGRVYKPLEELGVPTLVAHINPASPPTTLGPWAAAHPPPCYVALVHVGLVGAIDFRVRVEDFSRHHYSNFTLECIRVVYVAKVTPNNPAVPYKSTCLP